MAFLEVSDLKKSFGATEVLKGVSFSLEKGEVMSVIGSSGNGKTTLLRCLNFLELADGGEICVSGEKLFSAGNRYREKELRQKRLHFGLVFQNFNLFPQYSALDNVKLALDIHAGNKYNKKDKAAKKAALAQNAEAAARLLDMVGLSDKMSNYPCELSGGQCQRVAIARALALSPDILCFDEPTSALDPELSGEVLKVIRSLKSGDRCMIIVTHELRFARDVSDKVLFLADGAVEESGTPDKVFGAPESEKTKAFLQSIDI